MDIIFIKEEKDDSDSSVPSISTSTSMISPTTSAPPPAPTTPRTCPLRGSGPATNQLGKEILQIEDMTTDRRLNYLTR